MQTQQLYHPRPLAVRAVRWRANDATILAELQALLAPEDSPVLGDPASPISRVGVHVTVSEAYLSRRLAYVGIGDWIVKDDAGRVSVFSDGEFRRLYTTAGADGELGAHLSETAMAGVAKRRRWLP